MRLIKVTLENFRCYKTPFSIKFDDLTAIVGRNDVGKSTIMDALDIFFENEKPDKEDGSVSGEKSAVKIACVFDQLPSNLIIDSQNQTTLAKEFLLNDDGYLEVRKTYNCNLGSPKISAIEASAQHPSGEGVSDLLELKQGALVQRAESLGVDLEGVDRRKNSELRHAIWDHVDELNLSKRYVSLESDGAKSVWKALSAYIPAFALFKSDRDSSDQDAEAQDPLKSAIRDAIKGVEEQLKEVQTYVEGEVQKIADATVAKISEMDPEIASTLNPVISTGKWENLFKTSIVGDEGIPLNKRGSGVRRLVLLNFFRAKAESAAAAKQTGSVIYAVEEPETSQHPRNQRMLMSALTDIATTPERQVIVTTHTPMLARTLDDTTIRFIERKNDGLRTSVEGGNRETNRQIAESLGVLPDHNVRLFIGVEGKHDISFLKALSKLLREEDEDIPDLAKAELAGEMIFFPLGGSNLLMWANKLQALNRREFHLCDRDVSPPAKPKYDDYVIAVNGRDGCKAVMTNKREMENYIHPDAIIEAYAEHNINISFDRLFEDFDDVPLLVAQAVHDANSGVQWPEDDKEKVKRKEGRAKKTLNGLAMEKMTLERLNETDPDDELRSWLLDIADMMGSD